MAGWNSTTNCSYAAPKQCSTKITCDAHMVSSFDKSLGEKIWRMDSLLLISAILAGVTVGIGIYGQHYRHHRFTRFIFLGATTLILPVVSTVASMGISGSGKEEGRLIAMCNPGVNSILVVIWASLVQTIMVNTSAVVAVDDREGGNRDPPFELLVQSVCTFYLGISYVILISRGTDYLPIDIVVEVVPFALICAKIVFKYYAFEKSRQSFALGRNPHLIFGYMNQQSLQETSHHGEPMVAKDAPPPLLVMGEEKSHVEMQPLGYVFKDDSWTTSHSNGLVTIDRVWRMDNMLLTTTLKPQKDLCLSFALFKLLRCRFARYKVRNAASKGFSFFWSLLLKDGEHDRVFLVISDELSFLHDYYYSSLPISYSKYWLPIVGIYISLLSIACCCALMITVTFSVLFLVDPSEHRQIGCTVYCIREQLISNTMDKHYGSWYLNLVPVFLLLVLVIMAEVRDIATYICSNWTKVAVICHLVNHASLQHSLLKKKWIGHLLRCRCKLTTHWDEKMGQCTMLEIHARITLPVLLMRLLHLPDHKREVKVPAAVKICIMEVVRSTRTRNGGDLSDGTAFLCRRGQVGERLLWACNNKSTSYTILTWHMATSILEVRYPHWLDQEQGSSPIPNTNYRIAATHLSRYCAYLVTWCPELLPDDDAWSRSLYEDVKKDAERVLAGCTAGDSLTPEANYQQLIQVLSADTKHEVLKEGARLGKQLVELMVEGEDTSWKLLAEFWSEMMVYVAPSDNLKGHSEAIARGGELITLLWVLLFHAGIVSRPGEDDGVAPTSAGVV